MNKLTTEEVLVLSENYNLADGHAFRSWNLAEQNIIANISKIFQTADRRKQQLLESNYLATFFELSGQTKNEDYFQHFLCFTASSALEVVANYLRINKLSVALMEPCFDNLYDILHRHQVPLVPFDEAMMEADTETLQAYLRTISSDAIFLVSPNNPTGVSIPERNLDVLSDLCLREDKILIIDTCFRFYLPQQQVYDQYLKLSSKGIKCILIEDTGKTWPTLELKAPFFSISHHLSDSIREIYADFLLHVSPVAVQLVKDFLELPAADGLGYLHRLVAKNREVLYQQLNDTFLEPVEQSFMSVAWLKINAPIKSETLRSILSAQHVHVLAGNQFYWSAPRQGDSYLRIALHRDADMFEQAALKLGAVCKKLKIEMHEAR